MTTILILFMFFLVYLEVRPIFLWLPSMVLSFSSESHWHCLCWVFLKTLPCVLSFSLCSCGNKNLLVSYGEHYYRFWRCPLSRVTTIISGVEIMFLVVGNMHCLFKVILSFFMMLSWISWTSFRWHDEGKHSTLPIPITLFLYVVGILHWKNMEKNLMNTSQAIVVLISKGVTRLHVCLVRFLSHVLFWECAF
jgi:hypothetical protein